MRAVLTITIGLISLTAGPGFARTDAEPAVTGTIRYEDRDYGTNGFTGTTTMRPVRQAEVELVDADHGDEVIGTSTTDDAGFFSIQPTVGGVRNVRVRVLARRQSGIYNVAVLNNPKDEYGYAAGAAARQVDLGTREGFGTIDLTIADAPRAAEAFNVFDCAVWTYQHVDALNALAGTTSPSPIPALRIFWEPGSEDGTYFKRAEGAIHLLGNADVDPDGYDDDVILHELGHYVLANWSRDDSPGGDHSFDGLVDPSLAWSEGFATWWSSATRAYSNSVVPGSYVRPEAYVDTNAGDPLVHEIEGPSSPQDTVTVRNEGAVAAALWDILDPANEPHDLLPVAGNADTRDDIWRVLREYIPARGDAPFTIEDFFLGWEDRVGPADPQVRLLSGDAGTTGILNHRSILFYSDGNDSGGADNDGRDSATPFAGPVVPNQTFYRGAAPHAGDEDWFRVTLPAGPARIETENLRDGCDTVVEVYDAEGTRLADNDDRQSGDLSSLIELPDVAAGDYYVRVRPYGDRTGRYDLRVTSPPR